jgi:ATP-dependent Lon protease
MPARPKIPDLAAALGELPLFPLRAVVLFPGVLLPLHVFEPRYVRMVGHALATHRCLSVVYVPDANADLAGNPPIARVAGAGVIIEHMELPGGRFDILVSGRARVELEELDFVPPFRRARARLLVCPPVEVPELEVTALRAAADAFVAIVRERDPAYRPRLPADATAGTFADACAHTLVIDGADRQSLLETLDDRERVRRVTEILTVQRATLRRRPAGGMLN